MSISQLFAGGNLPNIVLIITDQDRTIQQWPASFLSNLPAMQQLMNTGLTFQNAFTGACMCSPSRATFLTSNYPAVTGVTTTGQDTLPLPAQFPNLATVLAKAGYETIVWNGKWHLTPGATSLAQYGFSGWIPPDAGTSIEEDLSTLGGGVGDNDVRFLGEVLSFLGTPANRTSPFCLVASFVNPHDVYVAPETGPVPAGYPASVFEAFPVPLPPNYAEDLATKPRAQANWAWNDSWNANATQQQYVNFYAYLQVLVDQQIMQILNAISNNATLATNTLIIRIADHGEMGVSHSLVEKFYNAYEESIHIPLIFSNPSVWPQGAVTPAMASLLDLVPTLASLLGVTGDFTGSFKGQDLSEILENPAATVQDFVHFTYDDIPSPLGPSVIRTLRTTGYTYSVYFTTDGSDADWELYDLMADPLQNDNVAGTAAYGQIQQTLDTQLQQTMAQMGTAPSFKWPPQQTSGSRGGPPNTGG